MLLHRPEDVLEYEGPLQVEMRGHLPDIAHASMDLDAFARVLEGRLAGHQLRDGHRHVKAILRKLDIHSRVEAAVIAVEENLCGRRN